jgi:hypothetical protein
MVAAMEGIDFTAVIIERAELLTWLEIVRRRDTCSQLLAIPDTAYEAGVRLLERETGGGKRPADENGSPVFKLIFRSRGFSIGNNHDPRGDVDPKLALLIYYVLGRC